MLDDAGDLHGTATTRGLFNRPRVCGAVAGGGADNRRGRSGLAATRLLARGWRRDARGWFLGTSGALATALLLMLVSAGIFAGLQQATQERVGDVFTGDLRVAKGSAAAIPPGIFGPNSSTTLDQAVSLLEADGGNVRVHMESQYVISRRSFLEAALGEDDQFNFSGEGDEVFGIGAIVGIDFDDPRDTGPLEQYILSGGFNRGAARSSMPLLMPADRLERFLSPAERSSMTSWPPSPQDLNPIRFEITAGRVREGAAIVDVIRRPAHVVGTWQTGIDALDSVTLLAPIEDVRTLLGYEPDAPVANVLLVEGGNLDSTRSTAQRHGWAAEGPAEFTHRYLGQMLDAVQVLATATSIVLFLIPTFLIIHGLARQLENQKGAIAVCYAIGVGHTVVRRALSWLVFQITLVAAAVTALLALVLGPVLDAALRASDAPVPLGFTASSQAAGLAAAVLIVSSSLALGVVLRSHAKMNLATMLRAS